MWVDPDEGLVWQRFTTSLYTYERPVGAVRTNGYVGISLGPRRSVYAHRLIWAATYGDPGELYVNHLNGVKHDNRIKNLELATPAENTRHAIRLGLSRPRRRLTSDQVEDILHRASRPSFSGRQTARELGVSPSLISMVVNRQGRFAEAAV